MVNMSGMKVAFLGAGNMAEAIFKGVISAGVIPAENIICNDMLAERLTVLKEQYGVSVEADTQVAVDLADVVVISVKPQNVNELLTSIDKNTLSGKLFVSICAGVLCSTIEGALNGGKVVRVMPNTPAFVGQGFTAVSKGKNASSDDIAIVEKIFSAVGEVLEVEENKLDSITAVSGSGPAYVFYFLESMVKAAMNVGFSQEDAKKMVFATFSGSLTLAKQSDDSLDVLRQKVTSKGGTTAAAISVMEKENLMKIVGDAILAAKERSEVLSRG